MLMLLQNQNAKNQMHCNAHCQPNRGALEGDYNGRDGGRSLLLSGLYHVHGNVAAGKPLHQHGQGHGNGERRLQQADDRQYQAGHSHGQDVASHAAVYGVHGLPAVLIPLGHGNGATGPQGAVEGRIGREKAQDQVPDAGDDVGAAGIEFHVLVLPHHQPL